MLPKEDARCLSPSAQEEKRKQAIRLHLDGEKINYISRLCGVRRQTVSIWIMNFKEHGLDGLLSQQRGRSLGEGRTLTPKQEQQLKKILESSYPEEHGLKNALWNRRCVMVVIMNKFNIDMPIRTVGHYLKRLGFTLQVPKKSL